MGPPAVRAIKLPTSSGLFGPDAKNGFVTVCGLSGVETGGSASVSVVIRAGSSTGEVISAMSLAEGTADTVHQHPTQCEVQMYAVISGSGTLAGSVFVA